MKETKMAKKGCGCGGPKPPKTPKTGNGGK
jgi:hypothetical protein